MSRMAMRLTSRFCSSRILSSWLVLFGIVLSALPVRAAHLLVSDFNNGIRRYDATTGQFVDTFIPIGSGGLTFNVKGLAIGPDGSVFVDSSNGILRYDGTSGAFIENFAPVGEPLTFGPDNNLYVADGDSVIRYDGTTGAALGTFVTAGSGPLVNPTILAFGPDGHLYVGAGSLDTLGSSGNIVRYNGTTGAFIDEFVPSLSGGLAGVDGMTFGPDGNLYVANARDIQPTTPPNFLPGHEILRFDGTTGAFLDVFADTLPEGNALGGIAFGPDGHLYVTSDNGQAVLRYDGTTGEFIDDFTDDPDLIRPMNLVFTGQPLTAGVPETSTLILCAWALGGLLCGRPRRRRGLLS